MNHPLPNGYTARPATRDDAECVATLWNDRSEITRGERPSTPEGVLRNWDHPKFDLSTDSWLLFAPNGTLVGYAHIRDVKDPPVDVFSGYAVHPTHDDAPWLWDELLEWLDAEARRVIPKAPHDARIALVAGASEEDVVEQRELERHGFDHSRTFHVMQIDLGSKPHGREETPIKLPEGIGIRTFVPGEDDEALVIAYCESFADHYGIIHQPFEVELEEWRELMREDRFDPSLWFLPYDAAHGTVVGLCVCRAPQPGAPRRARISDLGIRPPWRRRGIGRALLLHAFAVLSNRGFDNAVLSVDTESKSGAPALYEKVGMRSVRASHTYVKELRAGRNLVHD